MKYAVDLRDVSLCRGGVRILYGIDMAVERGEFVAILGPNGAGKTSLLSILPALVKAEGIVRVLGEDLQRLTARDRWALRKRIGYLPQLAARTSSPLPLRAREVVAIGLDRSSAARARAEDVMARLGIAHLGDRPYPVLSGGEQRKVHLARVLASRPELALLDEPAGHLDFRAQEELTELISSLWRESGATVLMVTHDPRHLPACLTRVVLMRAGSIVRNGPPEKALSDEALSLLYGRGLRLIPTGGRFVVAPSPTT